MIQREVRANDIEELYRAGGEGECGEKRANRERVMPPRGARIMQSTSAEHYSNHKREAPQRIQ